jgi:hypothetical protein
MIDKKYNIHIYESNKLEVIVLGFYHLDAVPQIGETLLDRWMVTEVIYTINSDEIDVYIIPIEEDP